MSFFIPSSFARCCVTVRATDSPHGQSHKQVDESRVKLYRAPEKPEEPAEILPPFPSALYYDAKVWRFAEQHGSKDALIWNVS